jgi:hypothetical protein
MEQILMRSWRRVDEAEITHALLEVLAGGRRLFSTEIDPSNVRRIKLS